MTKFSKILTQKRWEALSSLRSKEERRMLCEVMKDAVMGLSHDP
jgi:hypothetical protein